jgi:protein-tyrosine phosphatase
VLAAVKERQGVALIHCTTGKNISPTLLLAYMLLSAKKQDKHLPLLKAIQFVQSKAPGSNPSEQFLEQLVDLEVELFEDASVKIKGRGGGGRGRGGRGGKGKRGK